MNTLFLRFQEVIDRSGPYSIWVERQFYTATKRLAVRITLIGGIVLGFANPAFAAFIDVEIDTTSLAGTGAQLAFDFIDGDSIVNNTVTINSFTSDGALGAASTFGDVTGALPGAVTIGDTFFFNELLQGITLGTSISFTLDLTENDTGSFFPDQFSFFILDTDPFFPFPLFTTSDPTFADALFVVDITGAAGVDLQVFTPDANSGVQVTANVVTAVPEPSSLLLFLVGFISLGVYKYNQPTRIYA